MGKARGGMDSAWLVEVGRDREFYGARDFTGIDPECHNVQE